MYGKFEFTKVGMNNIHVSVVSLAGIGVAGTITISKKGRSTGSILFKLHILTTTITKDILLSSFLIFDTYLLVYFK